MRDYHITMNCILIFTCLYCDATEQPSENVLCLAEFQMWRERIENRKANNWRGEKMLTVGFGSFLKL